MATEVGHAYYGWSHQEMPDQDVSQEASISQMLDHGSISFGRYAVENLSWEKKSIFTCNRRQEELEKFRTRGIVAQKKAYFEEYFKRMRAAKSMQGKQQSEITVAYQDDTSSYRDSGGENEPVADFKYEGDQVTYVGNVCLEHGSTGVYLEEATHPSEVLQASSLLSHRKDSDENQKENCSSHAVQMQQLDPKFATDDAQAMSVQNSDNPGINSIDNQKENCYDYAVQMQQLDPKFAMDEAQAISVQNSDNPGINSIDNQKENCYDCAVQMQQLDPKFAMDEAPAISEQNIGNHGKLSIDGKWVSERDVNLSFNGRPLIAAKRTAPYARNTKQQRPKILHAENGTREETSQNKQTYKEERVSALKLKNPSRNELNLDSKRKSELKSSNRLNPVQVKAEINICTRMTAAAKLLSNHKSISIYSSKSVLEGQSKVTIPRPFSFATEKRAVTPSSLRDNTQISTLKLSDRMTSSLTHEKNRSLVQHTSERATMANDGKSRILEEKRNCEKGMLLVSDRHISFTRKGGAMVGFSKSRTINIPQGNKAINPCSGRENQHKGVARGIRELASHLSLNPSKMRYSSLSFDSKKSRQEKPHWR